MKITQHYLDCLSQASYTISDPSSGLAAVVDPRRDTSEYLEQAEADGVRIAYVIETHIHADFLSGHLELAEATGADIVYGSAARTDFPIRAVSDGERLSLGEVQLEIRETPGHTPESISIVVWETPDATVPHAVLTGDTLFIGDVGRPDLLSSVGVTAEELARKLYRSLHDKLLTLPDETRVLPGHGAGSACGKNLSTETASTIGIQRRTNYALAPMSEDRFVEVVTEGQPSAPAYFPFNADENRRARELYDEEPPRALDVDAVLAAQADGAIVLDGRDPAAFAAGHLRGAVNIGLDGRFAEYAGSVVDHTDRLVLVTDPGHAAEARTRLARIGFDEVVGAIEGIEAVLAARPELAERASRVTATELAQARDEGTSVQVVDVRNPGERLEGSVPGAIPIPLAELPARLDELDLGAPIAVYCAGGYRSSIAASWLRSHGARDASDVIGGYAAWAERPAA